MSVQVIKRKRENSSENVAIPVNPLKRRKIKRNNNEDPNGEVQLPNYPKYVGNFEMVVKEVSGKDGHLLNETEKNYVKLFLEMDMRHKFVFIYLFNRKHEEHWFFENEILSDTRRIGWFQYLFRGKNAEEQFQMVNKSLQKLQFFKEFVIESDLEALLNRVKVGELKKIAIDLPHVTSKLSKMKKDEILKRILGKHREKGQKLISNFFKVKKKKVNKDKIFSLIMKHTGNRFNHGREEGNLLALSTAASSTFKEIHMIYFQEPSKDSQKDIVVNDVMDFRYPVEGSAIQPVSVFSTRKEWDNFKTAFHHYLQIFNNPRIEPELQEKLPKFVDEELVLKTVSDCENALYKEKERMGRFPSYKLRKTAGYLYARALVKLCKILEKKKVFLKKKKKKKEKKLDIERRRKKRIAKCVRVYKMLLESPFLSSRQRGAVYVRLDIDLKVCYKGKKLKSERMKWAKRAAEKDALVPKSDKLEIQKRVGLIKVKKLKEKVIFAPEVKNPKRGRREYIILERSDQKQKRETVNVETVALKHYHDNHNLKGFHDHGMLIKFIFLLCFADIIYDTSVPGAFVKPYQLYPEDFRNGSAFYLGRKDKIDRRMAIVKKKGDELFKILVNNYQAYRGMGTFITRDVWESYEWDTIMEVLSAIDPAVLGDICCALIEDYAAFRVGFPDLTLWKVAKLDPENGRVVERGMVWFVEVKSETDQLSSIQRWWIEVLKTNGKVSVCKVMGKKV